MFQVNRFDPRDEKHPISGQSSGNEGKRKRKLDQESVKGQCKGVNKAPSSSLVEGGSKDDSAKEKQAELKKDPADSTERSEDPSVSAAAKVGSTLHVIAEESKPASVVHGMTPLKDADEAFDDFDIEAELLEGLKDDEAEHDGVTLDDTAALSDEVRVALHMSSLPIDQAAASWQLAPFLIQNLKRDGYKHFFPIQSLVIPDVISSERHAHLRARDVCVSSPTGSGKSLAFVIPVLNALANRNVRRLRALVILPSRDLASQVYEVFERYAHGSDLSVGLAIGRSDFEAEQKALTIGPPEVSSLFDTSLSRHRCLLEPGNLAWALEAYGETIDMTRSEQDDRLPIPLGGRSAVDVLVATPGRLIDHLDRTPGFTLQHLRFLVIDEADRLVNQSYHNWVGRVVAAASGVSDNAWRHIQALQQTPDSSLQDAQQFGRSPDGNSFIIDPITWRRGGTAADEFGLNNSDASTAVVASVCHPVQLRKLLFSATLTKDPQKLAALGLLNPKHFDAHHLQADRKAKSQRYSMPPRLAEYTVQCTAEQKPLILLALLLEHLLRKPMDEERGKNIMVVFTSSLDSTHRLARLLQLLWRSAKIGDPTTVAEFSSALSQLQRSTLMRRCTDVNDNVSVLVCSDGMSRGMDIPGVSVINYDVPSFAKTYVHRCGRSSRAGKPGMAITLLKGGQVGQFARMRRLIDDPDRVQEIGVQKELVRNAVSKYRECVRVLRGVIQAEKDGGLATTDVIPENFAA